MCLSIYRFHYFSIWKNLDMLKESYFEYDRIKGCQIMLYYASGKLRERNGMLFCE